MFHSSAGGLTDRVIILFTRGNDQLLRETMSINSETHGDYKELLHFLSQPSSYPHKPDSVQHIQTHISHVYIVPPYVYKLKKPLNLEFLDYSSLEKRHRFCQQEVKLNRRLCREVYLGVEAICQSEAGFQIIPEEQASQDRVVEYVVKMKQLPQEYFLQHYVANATLTSEHLDRLADTLVTFYQDQHVSEEAEKWGNIETIRYNTDENFRQVAPFVGTVIDEMAFEAIKKFTNLYFQKKRGLFHQRVTEKRIVDGHGDLHLDHIHISPDGVCIYDCIEFNDRFRYGDLASDLAYLAMDLDFHDHPKSESYLINQMAERLEDYKLNQILNFYKCYRAFVKGKVKSIQSQDGEVKKAEHRKLSEVAKCYFNLSLKYALLGSKPIVLIFIGEVGTGKSTLAKKLHETLNIDWFSSDFIRKKMAGVPLYQRTPESKRKFLYSDPMTDKTYRKLREKARSQLEAQKSAILDATFSNKEKRATFIHLLEARGIDYYFIETQASAQTVQNRLRDRPHQKHVISDARLKDFKFLKDRYEAPREINSNHLIQIDTDQPLEDSLNQLYTALIRSNVQGRQ